MTNITMAAIAAAGLLMFASPARSQAPHAIVEDVQGNPAGVEFMDYVSAGKVIQLGPKDSIVLSYLKSCWRESITAGVVTVGTSRSEVQGGKITREKVACDGGKIQLTMAQADQSGGVVYRSTEEDTTPQITLYGLSPVIQVAGGGTLLIERIDRPGERHVVALKQNKAMRGSFVDLATKKKILAAGGIYRAKLGHQQIVFRIDPTAKEGQPIISRLVRIPPAV